MTIRSALALALCIWFTSGCSSCSGSTGTTQQEAAEPVPAPVVEAARDNAMPSVSPDSISDPPPLADVAAPTPAQQEAFAAASNALALDLYARARTKEGNLAFSPASIEIALGMTWAGARGATADEMQRVLRIETAAAEFHEAASRILASLNDPSRQSYELRVTSRLFGERSYSFEQSFLDLTGDRYGAPLEPVDFRKAAAAERKRINGWVARQTGSRIQELLPPDSLSDLTRLVLVNAVYFLGQWSHAFPKHATTDQPFFVQGGGQTRARMMTQTNAHRYAEVDAVQVLELPYRGDELSMLLVLPRARAGLPAVESSLDLAQVSRWVAALREQRVEVHVPRFQIERARLPLTDMLPAMGMRLPFDPLAADFTGMARPDNPDERLHISQVFHEAFVKVDEEGTEAAAATAVEMTARGRAQPAPALPIFRADHPFLFFIRERRSGTILFTGRVSHPG